MKPMIDGLISGAGGQIAGRFLPQQYAQPVADLAIGYFRRNTTLKVIGARQLGAVIGSMFGGGGGNGGGGAY